MNKCLMKVIPNCLFIHLRNAIFGVRLDFPANFSRLIFAPSHPYSYYKVKLSDLFSRFFSLRMHDLRSFSPCITICFCPSSTLSRKIYFTIFQAD